MIRSSITFSFEKSADSLLSSKVQHVFRVVGSSEACGIEDAVMAAATIDVNDECIDGIYKAFGDRSIAYIAATSSKQLLSKFTRSYFSIPAVHFFLKLLCFSYQDPSRFFCERKH